jgi:hypothetical protein
VQIEDTAASASASSAAAACHQWNPHTNVCDWAFLCRSHYFAQRFNANKGLRTALWKAGFMKNRSKPNLLKQETTSLSCALRIMFRVYETETEPESLARVEDRITDGQFVCLFVCLFVLVYVLGLSVLVASRVCFSRGLCVCPH